jgi:hypothetical protein
VILGGVLTSEAGWRWIFAINVPIGWALLAAVPVMVPSRQTGRTGQAERARQPGGGLDITGAALVTAGTGMAIYGLVNVGSHGWGDLATILPLAGAAGLWTAFALAEIMRSRPLLKVELLTRRPVLAGSFLMLAAPALMVGGFFIGSFSLQHTSHYSALEVGLCYLPVAVATSSARTPRARH